MELPERAAEVSHPVQKYAGVAKPSVEAEGVKPGQRRRAFVMRGGLRTLSRRGSGVRIPSPAPYLRTPCTR